MKRRPFADPMPSREELWALRRGDDRGGLQRTWAEVAATTGRDTRHVERIAKNRIYVPPERVIDPRDYRPQLRESMTDQDVAAWQASPYCLCGCGAPTRRELSGSHVVPYGAHRLFRGSHESRMPWRTVEQIERNKQPQRRRRASASMRSRTIRADVIVEVMLDWRRAQGHTNWDTLSALSGVSRPHICDFVAGRHQRMQRVTAGKLLTAMEEPLRPEIAEAYQEWLQSQKSQKL